MQIGVMMFPSDLAIQPVELGRAVEERGFDSLWFPEHSHIPTSRKTPWGGRKDAPPLPDYYWRTHDPFVAFGAVAATTERIILGTGVTLVAQRDPIWLAKEVATLDNLSNGRFILGIGYGWNKEEMAHHGVAYTERRSLLRDKVMAMKTLWTEDEASFSGDHFSIESSWAWPKPLQRPHPPIVMGGAPGPKTLADIVEFCDGWMPIYGRYEIERGLENLRQAAEKAGRDPASIDFSVFGAPRDMEKLEHLAELGASRAVISLAPKPADHALARLDQYTEFVDHFHG